MYILLLSFQKMELTVLDELTLHIQQIYRDDIFALDAESLEDTHKGFRHAAYRQFTNWIHGKLGEGVRLVMLLVE